MTENDAALDGSATPASLRDWENIRPQRIDDVEVGPPETTYDGTMSVLRNRRNGQYIRLPELDLVLWEHMDGRTTLRDLVVMLFVEYQHFDPDHVQRLCILLGERGFFANYDGPTITAPSSPYAPRVSRMTQFLDGTRMSLPHADRFFTRLYEGGGWVLFTRAGLVCGLGLFLANLILFPHYFFTHEIHVLAPYGSYRWGLVSAMVFVAVSIFAHEIGHGLTTKHFGRDVGRAGFMLIVGLPAFFVDTTDMWMRTKWPRIAVSWSGPYTNAVLSGGALLLLHFLPPDHREGLFLFATINTLIGLYSLVPVMEKDGDYILMDLLGVPNLRPRAFRYVSRDLWTKVGMRQPFAMIDLLLMTYGTLALAGLIWYIALSIRLWEITIEELVRDVIAYPLLTLEIVLPALALIFIVYVVRKTGISRRKSSVSPDRTQGTRSRGD